MTGPSPWRVLGVPPGSGPERIRIAWRRRRLLYDPDSLATYSLLDETERRETVERIDEAYRVLLDEAPPSDPRAVREDGAVEGEPTVVEPLTDPAEPGPDPDTDPAGHLRWAREQRGVSLESVAGETKIRRALLERIEAGDREGLPAPVYVRGFVVQIARALRLPDPEDVAARYVDAVCGD